MTTVKRDLILVNQRGLHARASAKFVSTAEQFAARITVQCDGAEADARSIMDLLTLTAANGMTLSVEAVGEDAIAAVDALEMLVSSRFGEDK